MFISRVGFIKINIFLAVLPSGHMFPFFETYKIKQAYESQDFDTAHAFAMKQLLQNKPDAKTLYNCGDIAYKKGDYKQAIAYFDQALPMLAVDDDLYVKSCFNKANCCVQLKEFTRALDGYDKVLKVDPEHTYAAYNKEKVKGLIKEQEYKQHENPASEDAKQQENNKNQDQNKNSQQQNPGQQDSDEGDDQKPDGKSPGKGTPGSEQQKSGPGQSDPGSEGEDGQDGQGDQNGQEPAQQEFQDKKDDGKNGSKKNTEQSKNGANGQGDQRKQDGIDKGDQQQKSEKKDQHKAPKTVKNSSASAGDNSDDGNGSNEDTSKAGTNKDASGQSGKNKNQNKNGLFAPQESSQEKTGEGDIQAQLLQAIDAADKASGKNLFKSMTKGLNHGIHGQKNW